MSYTKFDHLQNPIVVCSRKGEIQYLNFVCSLYFKQPPRKLQNLKNITELIQCTEFDLKEKIENLKMDSPIVSPEVEIKVGSESHFVILKLIPEQSDILIHLQDFSIERHLHAKYKEQIVELRETHEQIVKSDKLTALGELIAGVSHEISSPLMVANDCLINITEDMHKKDYPRVSSQLVDLEKEIHRIKQIVNNMQSMAKNKDETHSVINVSDVIEDSIKFLKDLSLLNNCQIHLNLSKQFILANSGKLQQVLINLLKNSLDAMMECEKSEINIRVEKNAQSVLIHVEDSGPGIEEPEKIFDMFYTTKELGEGTGLGLAISQKILQSFHGEIKLVESKNGAHFVIDIPRLEFESFTVTNKYLSGEAEIEDQKAVIYSDSLADLDIAYKSLKDKSLVLILTHNKEGLEDVCDSYLADKVYSFDKSIKLKDFEVEYLEDLAGIESKKLGGKS